MTQHSAQQSSFPCYTQACRGDYSRQRIIMELNETIHQPVRLRVMSALCALPKDERIDFSTLRTFLGVTDGNLGGHLRKLSSAGYIDITKSFIDQKPRTRLRASSTGRRAFLEHVRALQEVIRGPVDFSGR